MTVGGNNANTTYSGALSGQGSLTKVGTGNLILSGNNTYTGTTYVKEGTLKVQGAAISALLTNTTTDISAGTLAFDYSGSSSVANTVKNALAASYNGGVNSFASGAIYSTKANTNSYALGWVDDAANSTVAVRVTLYGDATLDGAVDEDDLIKVLTNYGLAGVWGTGDFTYDDQVNEDDLIKVLTNYGSAIDPNTLLAEFSGKFSANAVAMLQSAGFSVVPEPSVYAMLIGGLIGLLAYAWRRRKQ